MSAGADERSRDTGEKVVVEDEEERPSAYEVPFLGGEGAVMQANAFKKLDELLESLDQDQDAAIGQNLLPRIEKGKLIG